MAAVPFRLHFTLTRRQRLGPHVLPWAPCLAASLGFTLGVIQIAAAHNPWLFALLVLPPVVCRRFLLLLVRVMAHPTEPVEITVDDAWLELRSDDATRRFPLVAVVQVFRAGEAWTVLFADNAAVTIPAAAIAPGQLDHLKEFAWRSATRRPPRPASDRVVARPE
jgi:hypothetical protein